MIANLSWFSRQVSAGDETLDGKLQQVQYEDGEKQIFPDADLESYVQDSDYNCEIRFLFQNSAMAPPGSGE